jgi:ABC-type lipoprotein export system ATPase subunit
MLVRFFRNNLTSYQLSALVLLNISNAYFFYEFLSGELNILRTIPTIFAKDDFVQELFTMLISQVWLLTLYTTASTLIEMIGQLAVSNATSHMVNMVLRIDLSTISQAEYEIRTTSIIHHNKNVIAAIRNIFIEFPRKLIACYYFISVLREISNELMLYCLMMNIIFIIIPVVVSYARKIISSRIVNIDTMFSLRCSDISSSIQSYKVDDRLNEIQGKMRRICMNKQKLLLADSLLVGITDTLDNISSQFMIGFLGYIYKSTLRVNIEDLLYGVRSSGKFIEKMIGVVGYVGDVIRQYESFGFFNTRYPIERIMNIIPIDTVEFISEQSLTISDPCIVNIKGPNGSGKTTLLLNFLGISYRGTISKVRVFNGIVLSPLNYRTNIAFVQQNIPLSYDHVTDYVKSVSGIYPADAKDLIFSLLNINVSFPCGHINRLSGGEAKFLQILAAVSKLLAKNLDILVMDEPSNNLDKDKVNILLKLMLACMNLGKKIFIVTHDDRIKGTIDFILEK